MMDDYISRDELKRAFISAKTGWLPFGAPTARVWGLTLQSMFQILKKMPAADVVPVVRGEWIEEPDRHLHWHCSKCGYVIGIAKMDCNFCPNCGADMRGGDGNA